MELIDHNKSGFNKYKYDNFIEDTQLPINNDSILKLPSIRCNLNDDILPVSDDEDYQSGEDEHQNLINRKNRKDIIDKRSSKAKKLLEEYKSSKF